MINNHIGILKLEPSEYVKLDDENKKLLVKHKVHMQPANKERLYLSKDLLERILCNVEHKSKHMLLDLNKALEKIRKTLLRRAAILKVKKNNQSRLALIQSYLKQNTILARK